MNFELKLDMPDPEQEAVWLQDYLDEQELDGIRSKVKESSPEAGTMDGGVLLGILVGAISGMLGQRLDVLFQKLWKHFDGKRAAFELTGKCPDSEQEFTLKFNNSSKKTRDEAIAEFKERMKQICGEQ